nr:unnamed protein product [Callosobruchus analis]
MSEREASMLFKISRSTIKGRMKAVPINKPGHPNVFTSDEELSFASHLNKMCDFGFPVDEIQFRLIVKSYLARLEKQ